MCGACVWSWRKVYVCESCVAYVVCVAYVMCVVCVVYVVCVVWHHA